MNNVLVGPYIVIGILILIIILLSIASIAPKLKRYQIVIKKISPRKHHTRKK